MRKRARNVIDTDDDDKDRNVCSEKMNIEQCRIHHNHFDKVEEEAEKRKEKKRMMKNYYEMNKDDERKNGYIGWKVSSSSCTHKEEGGSSYTVELDRIDALSVQPEWFYKEYISKRKPCILLLSPQKKTTGGEEDEKPAIWEDNNFQRMKELAGHVDVEVETRTSKDQSYGKGQKVIMTFDKFLQKLSSKEEHDLFYLTTQSPILSSSSSSSPHLHHTDDHHDDCIPKPYRYVMPALVKNLFFHQSSSNQNNDHPSIIPLQPDSMGNLIPQSIQLWMGRTSTQTSSGLHHDFHDNFYQVFQGEKEFHLYSPADAFHMNTNGQITKVHSNGLIQYRQSTTTYSDGSPIPHNDPHDDNHNNDNHNNDDDEATRLMQELENAEESFNNCPTDPNAKQRYETAEENLNHYMESMLENNDNDEDNDEDDEDEEDVDFWETAEKLKQTQDSLTLEVKEKIDTIANGNLRKKKNNNHTIADSDNDCNNTNDDTEEEEEEEEPAHFCKESFIECQNVSKLCVKVKQGEILYLPASWFHKVFSSGGTHIALNYWFHPPSLDGGGTTFQNPYVTNYWNQDWKQKEE